MGTFDAIWGGDKLGRQSEAEMLNKFLDAEVAEFSSQSREQSYVLGLDAQYGEGKTWFLKRFRQHLAINHPVAFIDAWVDDANEEPLVSIMAALEDALEPYLSKPTVKERLGQVARAAVPILGKAAIGAFGQFVKRHIGEGIGDTAASALTSASKIKPGQPPAIATNASEDAAIDSFVKDVTALVDGAAKAMVDQYRQRQTSREAFKQSLSALAQSLSAQDDTSDTYAPIYIIIDELDRCRPSYAISLLEDIKHLFDVPGVVFIIALHGEQLEHSIKAVYGEGFKSKAYLQRFFSRKYELRRVSIKELVEAHFSWVSGPAAGFSAPQVSQSHFVAKLEPEELAGELLSGWQATPREAQAVIDGLRIFVRDWRYPVPIELPLALYLLLELVRGISLQLKDIQLESKMDAPEITFFVNPPLGNPNLNRVRASAFMNAYRRGMSEPLLQLIRHLGDNGPEGYVKNQMQTEMSKIHGRGYVLDGEGPMSVWSEYRERLQRIGRLIDATAS